MRTLRFAVEPWVRRWWAGELGPAGAVLGLLSLPAVGLYRAGVAVRDAAFETGLRRVRSAPVPIVSIGNLAVGGSGKTPVAAWIAGRLQGMGVRPAVLLRGYGLDEVWLHRRWNPRIPVLARADRVEGAREAVQAGADVVVLDDGFQHRRLARDLDIVLVSAEQPFPGRLLPAGPWREGPGALRRADLVVVTHRELAAERVEGAVREVARLAPERSGIVLGIVPGGWQDLSGGPAAPPTGDVLAVAGVAQPRLFRYLAARTIGGGAEVELLAFPDHHGYDAADARAVARRAAGRTVVTTEKDAVKLSALAALLPDVRVLTLTVRPERGGDVLEAALSRIAALAGSADRGGGGGPEALAERPARRSGGPGHPREER